MRILHTLLLLAATLSVPAIAGPIDLEQALQNAAEFRSSMHGARRAATTTDSERNSALRHVYTHYTASGQPAFYVFTTGDEGYVIASADDEAMSILAYSTEGTFDPENIPDGMKYMFGLYAEEIGSVGNATTFTTTPVGTTATLAPPTSAATTPSAKAPRKADATLPYEPRITTPIAPLLQTRWGQLQPYNRYCPFTLTAPEADGRSATGCMTTALAQIMRYHEHPKRGQGTTYMEVKRGITYDPEIINYYEHTYNWDLMYAHKDQYPHTYYSNGVARYSTDAPANHHVAQLMYDLGVALRTEYGPSSGAINIRIIPALLNYFDYDPSIELINRSQLSSYEVWNDFIIADLLERRPVYIEGVTNDKSSGHAFVCDGYDGKGYFHINWGWDGMSNDYFLMTALDPYQQGVGGGNSGFSNGLALVRNIKPNATGKTFDPYIYCSDRKPIEGRPGYLPAWGIWVTNSSYRELGYISEFAIGQGQWFAATLNTGTNMNMRGRIGILAILPDGTRQTAWDNGGTPVQMLSNTGYQDFHVNIQDAWKVPGTRAYYVYQPADKDELRYIYNGDGEICSFTFMERDGQLYAVLDRSEPGSTVVEPTPDPDPTPDPEPEPDPDPSPDPDPDPITPDPITPDPVDPVQQNAQLASIYVGYGTSTASTLQLYPEFNPDVHHYLALRSDSDFDMPNSCLLFASYTYTIIGSAVESGATVSDAIRLQPMSGWNRATITCTAPDGVTKQDYHIILLGDGSNYSADVTKKPVSIVDLALMLRMLQSDYGYREAAPTDTYFDRLVNQNEFDRLVNLLLKKQ